MLPITVTAFRYVSLHGKCRLHSAVGAEGIKLNINVNFICGRWKRAYVGCIVEVSNILTANQDLHGYGKARYQKKAFVLKWVMEFTAGRTADVSEIFIYPFATTGFPLFRINTKFHCYQALAA
jgi:hypothetical protein